MSTSVFQTRRSEAARRARREGLGALLITHLPDVQYLSGFTGSNAALTVFASGKPAVLMTDGRYTKQVRAEAAGTKVEIVDRAALPAACALIAKSGVKRCGVDAAHTTVEAWEQMKRSLPAAKRGILKPVGAMVSLQREVKDAEELRVMRKAAKLGCRLFEHMLGYMQAGMTELAVAAELEHEARLRGAQGMSFTTIVATGERSAMPHGHASPARLPRNGFITLDFGVILDGYCSDMTRTVYMGRATNEERQAYEAVLASQMAGVDAVKAGVACAEVDEACRSVLRRAGLAKWFTHGTGHGVGLEIHEGPRLGTGQRQKLEPGMVVTIEPGVYLTRKKGRNFGIRIEDMVVVKKNGGEVITAEAPKGWIQI